MKKGFIRAAVLAVVIAICFSLSACSGSSLGMKRVIGKPSSEAITALESIVGKDLTLYGEGELDPDGIVYKASDDSLIPVLSTGFTAVELLLDSSGNVETVQFYVSYSRDTEFMTLSTQLQDYYNDDFTYSNNYGLRKYVWKDTPDGDVAIKVTEPIFKLVFSDYIAAY